MLLIKESNLIKEYVTFYRISLTTLVVPYIINFKGGINMVATSLINLTYKFNCNVTLGFDINILIDALQKIQLGETPSRLQLSSIDNAKSFFETIRDFCEGKHTIYYTGISGAEAFSLYVSATKFTGTLQDVQISINPYITLLDDAKHGNQFSESMVQQMVKVFEEISQYINQQDIYGFTNQGTGWRL